MTFKYIKLAHAIKVGTKELQFVSKTTHDAVLEGSFVIKITEKFSGSTSYTTLFNTIYWEADEQGASTQTTVKGSKAAKVESKISS